MVQIFWRVAEMLLMIDDKNPNSTRQWRVLVSMMMVGVIVHILWACGGLKFIGIDGFAQSVEVKAITARLDQTAAAIAEVQNRQLETAITDTRIAQCNAITKRFYTDHLRDLADEYFRQNKRPYEIPRCDELN
jgi:hypothetical protein